RAVPQAPAFSVTANFVGKRNYGAEEIKSAVSEGVMANHDWRYTSDDAVADLNVRVFIENEIAFVGLRLGRTPLHDREYKKVHRAASLKPPVAAAMLRLIEIEPGQSLLDPCCGAGTILAEAGIFGAAVCGGDIDLSAVATARVNVGAAGIVANIN